MFSILIVDDEPYNFDVIENFLTHPDYQLHYVASGQEAISQLEVFEPDLIMLDVMMPSMDGIITCQKIKSLPRWEKVPIIAVTALATKESLARCLSAGADDFISKPVNRLELQARVRSMLRIREQYLQLKAFNTKLELTVKQRTARLRSMIFQDTLTGLPSRSFLLHKLAESIRNGYYSFALIYLDCDQFKLINGSFGHAVGDNLLLAVAQRLRQHLGQNDFLARVGEDEFCFLLKGIKNESNLDSFIQNLMKSFATPFSVANRDIFLTVSMGATLGDKVYRKPEEPLQDADTAMYQAKSRGRGNYQLFDRQIHLEVLSRLTLENDLQTALEQEQFITYYQPIVHLETRKVVGFEALIRWQHPRRGLVMPVDFIGSLEMTGAIIPVGMIILRQACQQLWLWQEQTHNNLFMSVNLSVRQFACPTLVGDIKRILKETGINPAQLKLEITETTLMENKENVLAVIEELRKELIQISLDDFGTGFSSLGSLELLPVNNLKIDRSFVNKVNGKSGGHHVLEAIIAMSQDLGLLIIAEGVETTDQLEWLKKTGCQFGQGYLFSKPLPPSEIESLFLRKQELELKKSN
ncbi:MAG: EAL domain-containing protein [Chlorogloea purpurea SAG 13.99]|nr:EAL domain-containing protein [Chlorogloea purpurea SAG 13.99]